MKIARQRDIPHPPADIWKAISTVGSISKWLPGAMSAEQTGGPAEGKGRLQRVHRQLYSREIEIDQEVIGWEPERALGMRHLRETSNGRELRSLQDFVMTITIVEHGRGGRVRAEYAWTTQSLAPTLLSLLFAGRVMGRELQDVLGKIDKLAKAEG